MSSRARPIFKWRKNSVPVVMTAFIGLITLFPLSFIAFFGVITPFWDGEMAGLQKEVMRSFNISVAVIWNVVLQFIEPFIFFPNDHWYLPDWKTSLVQQGLWNAYLLRLVIFFTATCWLIGALALRAHLKADLIQGYEHAGGPELLQGRRAKRGAMAAIAAEARPEKNGLIIADNITLSLERELGSFFVFGAQGRGKSAVLRTFETQMIGRPQTKLVVFDQKGDLTATWPQSNVIFFAPHDIRTHGWAIGRDIKNEIAAQEFAAMLIPIAGGDTNWPKGGRDIFEAVLIALQNQHGTNWGFKEMLHALQLDPIRLREYVGPYRPDVLNYLGVDQDGEFTRTSIGYVTNFQAAVMSVIRPLVLAWGDLPEERQISLNEWILQKNSKFQTLIIQNYSTFEDVSIGWIRPVIERIVKVSGSPQIPDNGNQRLWLIIDEFPQLKHMPSLLKVPETHRSKGVSLVLTAQSLSQIYEHYSKEEADMLMELLQTKIVLRIGQSGSAVRMINDWLGKLRWRDPADSGFTETGARKPIPEYESDLISAFYLSTLGARRSLNRVDGLILGLDGNAYRLSWPYYKWPKQRPGVRLAPWAQV